MYRPLSGKEVEGNDGERDAMRWKGSVRSPPFLGKT